MACKQAFDKYRTEQFAKPVATLTLEIYRKADAMLVALLDAKDPGDSETAKTINDFWRWYFGELVLIEPGDL